MTEHSYTKCQALPDTVHLPIDEAFEKPTPRAIEKRLDKCTHNRKRNAEVAGRKEVKVGGGGKYGGSYRMEPMLPVKKRLVGCNEFSEYCRRYSDPVQSARYYEEPVLATTPKAEHFISKSEVVNGLFYTFHKRKKTSANKMDNMISLNTNPFDNPFCLFMNATGCQQGACGNPHPFICGSCYSVRALSRQSAPRWRFNQNTSLLSRGIICKENIPDMNAFEAIRFNAEGELVNDIHLVNLMEIANANPLTTCTLFTKRWDILEYVLNQCGVRPPRNFFVIYSNPYVDYPITFSGVEERGQTFRSVLGDAPIIAPKEFLRSDFIYGIFNVVDRMPMDVAFRMVREAGDRPQYCSLNCFDCMGCYPVVKDERPGKKVIIEEIKRK